MSVALVTGVTGQDGTILARRLLGEGVTVHGFALAPDPGAPGVPAGVVWHAGDLRDAAAVRRVMTLAAPDEVYHLAGVTSVAQSWANPAATAEVTGVGAVNVFEAARRVQDDRGRPVRVVLASSAEVFGAPATSPQDESTPIRPVNPYGAAKAFAQHMAAVYRAMGTPVATCICYNHESPLRPPTFVTRKVTLGAASIARGVGGPLRLGSLDVRRDWGWAEDYVDAMVRAVRHSVPDDFVVATGITHSVRDLVVAAFTAAGVDDWAEHVVVDPSLARPVDAVQLCGDSTKARSVLGWSPTVVFGDMVARMVAHDLAEPSGGTEV